MKIAVVNISKSRIHKHSEYHTYTIKNFVEDRSSNKFSVDIENVFISDDAETSAQLIDSKSYDIVLFRILYWNVDYAFSVIKQLTNNKPLLGVWGYDSYMYPELYLKDKLSFIVRDEPELSLYELAEAKDDDLKNIEISGIILKKDDEITYGPIKVIDNLDMISSPYLNKLIEISEDTAIFWEVARGCLFKCDYCVDFSHADQVRYHGFNYLEKELEFFKKKQVREIIIGAPIFNLSHQHVKKILTLAQKILPDTMFEIQVRPDILTKEEIDLLSEMNVHIRFGIQTFKKKVLEDMLTSLNLEKTLSNIKYMNNYSDLPFSIDLLAGLPKMSYYDFLEDVETAIALWPINLNVYRLSTYPGTRIFNRIRELEYNVEASYPYRVISTPGFSKREFEKVETFINGIEFLYNKARFVSILPIIAKAFEIKSYEIIETWNKWIKKNLIKLNPDIPFLELLAIVSDFFTYMTERFQKRKLRPLILDIIKHNAFFTTSLTTENDDIVTYPYEIEAINNESVIGINDSAYFDRFNYDIEDLVNATFMDLKKYISEVDRESLLGLTYRLDGAVLTATITDAEGEDLNSCSCI